MAALISSTHARAAVHCADTHELGCAALQLQQCAACRKRDECCAVAAAVVAAVAAAVARVHHAGM
jgi:hypothetical protein